MKYRPEIDGLRAIAVVSVIFFHAKLKVAGHLLTGGFLGVDIFFVISGFLITSILLRELKEQRFSFTHFYERRARRILPVLSVVCLSTLPFAWLIMDEQQLISFGKSLLSLSLFSSNFLFWQESGYFETAAEFKPLLHTWSLAVEEQFYFVVPVLLFLLWKYFKKKVHIFLLLLFIASLLLSEWMSRQSPMASFFLLPSRGWELLAGSLLAFFQNHPSKEKIPLKPFLPSLGLVLILHSMFQFDENTLHPSMKTLPSILGTVLIIAFASPKEALTRMLSSKIFVGVGLISYSLYLWHQPVLIFAKLFGFGQLPSHFHYWYMPSVFLLSYLSWRYVEQPFRKKAIVQNKTFFISLATAYSLLIVSGVLVYSADGFPGRFQLPEVLVQSFKYGDETPIPHKCVDVPQSHEDENLWCSIGSPSKQTYDFILFGDSHAYAAIPQFHEAAKTLQLSGVVVAQSGCPPLLDVEPQRGELGPQCVQLNRKVVQFIKRKSIQKIFLVARWNYYIHGNYDGLLYQNIGTLGKEFAASLEERKEVFSQGLHQMLRQLSSLNSKVHLFSQFPQHKYIPKSIYRHVYAWPEPLRNTLLQSYALKKKDHENFSLFTHSTLKKASKQYTDVFFHDYSSYFCQKEVCYMGKELESYYYDKDHVSKVGSLLLLEETKKILSL